MLPELRNLIGVVIALLQVGCTAPDTSTTRSASSSSPARESSSPDLPAGSRPVHEPRSDDQRQRAHSETDGRESVDDDFSVDTGANTDSERELRQFAVLDPHYDYNPIDRLSAKTVARRFPVHADGRSQVAFLKDGHTLLSARMWLLDQAEHSVRIQSLVFRSDEAGHVIADKLIELANRGVDVQVIIDPVANALPEDQAMYLKLKRNNIGVEGYEILYLNWIRSLTNVSNFGIALSEANMRYHEKYLIIDAERPSQAKAIIGGANIGNEYFRVNPDDPVNMWRDRDVMVRGRVAQDMGKTFDTNRTALIRERQASALSDAADQLLPVLGHIGSDIIDSELDPSLTDRATSIAAQDFVPQWQDADIRFLQSRPRQGEDLIAPAYIDMINRSISEILITNSYLIPDEHLIAALTSAAKRGVKIKILTNHADTSDYPQLNLVSRSLYKNILGVNLAPDTLGKITIYEWSGDRIAGNGEGLNHAKYAVFDGKAVIVGSYNLDPRSRHLNSESIVVFESPRAAQDYISVFDLETSGKFSQPVTWQQALKFHDPDHLTDKLELQITSLMAPLL